VMKLNRKTLNMLQLYNLNHDDFTGGSITVSFYKLTGNQLVQTTSLSQADAERIDMFRKPIGDMSLFTPNPDQGPISVIFSGSSDAKKHIIQFAYTYWPIDYQTTATYPLKTSTEAWTELQNGRGLHCQIPNRHNNCCYSQRVFGVL